MSVSEDNPPGRRRPRRRDKGPGNGRDEFLTPTEVADRLLVAPVTVRLWASKNLLPSVTTPGGHRRFRLSDVDLFARERQQLIAERTRVVTRILVIDDDPQFARYLCSLVSKHAPNVQVEVAHNGFAAGIKCEAMRPDVVTLDLEMPDMDGYEICGFLRKMFGKTKPRIVALTGFASRENVENILAVGADVCIAKTSSASILMRELGLVNVAEG